MKTTYILWACPTKPFFHHHLKAAPPLQMRAPANELNMWGSKSRIRSPRNGPRKAPFLKPKLYFMQKPTILNSLYNNIPPSTRVDRCQILPFMLQLHVESGNWALLPVVRSAGPTKMIWAIPSRIFMTSVLLRNKTSQRICQKNYWRKLQQWTS